MDDQAVEYRYMVYIGRAGIGSNMSALMVDLDEDEARRGFEIPRERELQPLYWGTKLVGAIKGAPYPHGGIRPGAVLKFKRSPDNPAGSVVLQSRDLLRRWENEADVARWEVRDRATAQADQDARRKKRWANEDRLAKRLEPLREMYGRLPARERAAFLGWVMYRITRL